MVTIIIIIVVVVVVVVVKGIEESGNRLLSQPGDK